MQNGNDFWGPWTFDAEKKSLCLTNEGVELYRIDLTAIDDCDAMIDVLFAANNKFRDMPAILRFLLSALQDLFNPEVTLYPGIHGQKLPEDFWARREHYVRAN